MKNKQDNSWLLLNYITTQQKQKYDDWGKAGEDFFLVSMTSCKLAAKVKGMEKGRRQ